MSSLSLKYLNRNKSRRKLWNVLQLSSPSKMSPSVCVWVCVRACIWRVRLLFPSYLRCYVVGSELRGHQVPLVNFGKAKVAQLHRCILWKKHHQRWTWWQISGWSFTLHLRSMDSLQGWSCRLGLNANSRDRSPLCRVSKTKAAALQSSGVEFPLYQKQQLGWI